MRSDRRSDESGGGLSGGEGLWQRDGAGIGNGAPGGFHEVFTGVDAGLSISV